MTVDVDDPATHLWRVMPVGLATLLVAVLTVLADPTPGGPDLSPRPETLVIALWVTLFVGPVMAGVCFPVWSTAFLLLRRRVRSPRARAVLASAVCCGAVFLPCLAAMTWIGVADGWGGALSFTAYALWTSLVGVGLTWWAFRRVGLA